MTGREHVCLGAGDYMAREGQPMRDAIATCGTCELEWCARCDPCPSAMCHACNGRGYTIAPRFGEVPA